MSKPMIRIHNVENDEIIDREMTTAEFNQYKKDAENVAKQQAEIETKQAARQSLLDRLGITADEAKLLLG
jgi:predicted oxidoreductase